MKTSKKNTTFVIILNFFATYIMYDNDIDMATNDLEKEFLDMIEAQKRVIYKVCYIYAQDGDDLKAYLSC